MIWQFLIINIHEPDPFSLPWTIESYYTLTANSIARLVCLAPTAQCFWTCAAAQSSLARQRAALRCWSIAVLEGSCGLEQCQYNGKCSKCCWPCWPRIASRWACCTAEMAFMICCAPSSGVWKDLLANHCSTCPRGSGTEWKIPVFTRPGEIATLMGPAGYFRRSSEAKSTLQSFERAYRSYQPKPIAWSSQLVNVLSDPISISCNSENVHPTCDPHRRMCLLLWGACYLICCCYSILIWHVEESSRHHVTE